MTAPHSISNGTTELLPCPFCGGKAAASVYGQDWLYKVECKECYGSVRGFDQCQQDANDAWNTRMTATKEAIASLVLKAMQAKVDSDTYGVSHALKINADRAEKAADEILAHAPALPSGEVEAFQPRVLPWMLECFGPVIPFDRQERNHRFIEEALELVQACGCTQNEAHQLVDYVYGRDQGDINQEVGGVMVTLAALCIANGFDMHGAAETELTRIWTKVEQIRAKQAAKPKHSPLPASSPTPQIAGDVREIVAQSLLDRFIQRGEMRLGGPTFPRGAKMADLPSSYADDFYIDADAVLAALFPQAQAGGTKSAPVFLPSHTSDERLPSSDAADAGAGTASPPFSRWADTIESASLAISPKGSEALDALAAEVRAVRASLVTSQDRA